MISLSWQHQHLLQSVGSLVDFWTGLSSIHGLALLLMVEDFMSQHGCLMLLGKLASVPTAVAKS
jgi:hypothetical protein